MTHDTKKMLVENYVRAYNEFDVEGMTKDLDEEIIFRNFSGGERTLELKGIDAFRSQARQAADFFRERRQQIENIAFGENSCEVDISYQATLASDLPNGLKAGDRIELKGKSIFRFGGEKIVEIEDIS